MSASTRPATAEGVALELYYLISQIERSQRQDRNYILSLYTECLKAATGNYGKGLSKPVFGDAPVFGDSRRTLADA